MTSCLIATGVCCLPPPVTTAHVFHSPVGPVRWLILSCTVGCSGVTSMLSGNVGLLALRCVCNMTTMRLLRSTRHPTWVWSVLVANAWHRLLLTQLREDLLLVRSENMSDAEHRHITITIGSCPCECQCRCRCGCGGGHFLTLPLCGCHHVVRFGSGWALRSGKILRLRRIGRSASRTQMEPPRSWR